MFSSIQATSNRLLCNSDTVCGSPRGIHLEDLYPVRMCSRGRMIGLSVSQSVCQSVRPSGLSSEGLVEGLFQDRIKCQNY